MLIGTNFFVSREAAIRYYRPYANGDEIAAAAMVHAKFRGLEINFGKPCNLKPGESLVTVDDGTRYGIEDGRPCRWCRRRLSRQIS